MRKNRKKERWRQQVITGRNKNSNERFRGAPEASRDLFIYRVHPETLDDGIKDLISSEGCEIRNLACVSNPNAKFKSYKLTVPLSQFAKLHSEDFPWPEGVKVRKFVPPSYGSTDSNTTSWR